MNRLKNEEGSSLVEFAISVPALFMVLFGLIQFSLAFYTFNYVSDAARIATRYAVVRGPESCLIAPSFPNCNLNPSNFTSGTNPLLTYLSSAGFPGVDPKNMTVKATWLVENQDASGVTTWATTPTCSSTNVDAYGNSCNAVGNAVNVVVTYNFPLNVPFWKNTSIPLTSTSQMVISE